MNAKNLISAGLVALGVTVTSAHACGNKSVPNGGTEVKQDKGTLMAGMSAPAGILAAGAGVAMLAGRGKKRRVAGATAAAATTSAFDYPSGDQW